MDGAAAEPCSQAIADALARFLSEVQKLDDELTPQSLHRAAADCTKEVCRLARPDQKWVEEYGFQGLLSAIEDTSRDNPCVSLADLAAALRFAAELLRDAIPREQSIVHAEHDASRCSYQLAEPPGAGNTLAVRRVSRVECVELLAAAFFGFISRSSWSGSAPRKRKQNFDTREMPMFSFDGLWEYDTQKWNTKNFVLGGVLLYFHLARKAGREALQREHLVLTRKAVGPTTPVPDDVLLCPLQLREDGVSIHDFAGEQYLLADFANEYLGGAVLRGGGSQEESMFIEYTELMAVIFLAEKMLEFEAIEISNLRRFVDHNMQAARHLSSSEQFCRPLEGGAVATAVAFDAIPFNAYGKVSKGEQYNATHIQRELRKCTVALRSAEEARRTFVTGNWGCGCFRGDIELKYVLQWICCSLEPSITDVIFCPFDQSGLLKDAGLEELVSRLAGKTSVKSVLEALTQDPDYAASSTTFGYLFSKFGDSKV